MLEGAKLPMFFSFKKGSKLWIWKYFNSWIKDIFFVFNERGSQCLFHTCASFILDQDWLHTGFDVLQSFAHEILTSDLKWDKDERPPLQPRNEKTAVAVSKPDSSACRGGLSPPSEEHEHPALAPKLGREVRQRLQRGQEEQRAWKRRKAEGHNSETHKFTFHAADPQRAAFRNISYKPARPGVTEKSIAQKSELVRKKNTGLL